MATDKAIAVACLVDFPTFLSLLILSLILFLLYPFLSGTAIAPY
ncbi:MAG: hypothetical protein QNJ38_01220 [Prochloraceae cyanobacterium]|nr:hypothetical protein [Prochloraceae cyanobacterium]